MKRCEKCGETKCLAEFYKKANGEAGHRSYCKSCFRETCNTNVKAFENKLVRDYGLTAVEYNEIHDAQGGKCQICSTTVSNSIRETAGERVGVVDHCHTSKKVRGILCSQCNIGLGNFKDNPDSLKNALMYLGRHGYGC